MSKTNVMEPGEPDILDNKKNKEKESQNSLPTIWKLWYHYGSSIPQTLMFVYNGMMTEAVIRARKHCEFMGYRFIKIKRAIVDLNDRERRRKTEKK